MTRNKDLVPVMLPLKHWRVLQVRMQLSCLMVCLVGEYQGISSSLARFLPCADSSSSSSTLSLGSGLSYSSKCCHFWELVDGIDVLEGWVMLLDSFPGPVRLRGVELSSARYVLREHSHSSSVTSDYLSSSSTMLVSV